MKQFRQYLQETTLARIWQVASDPATPFLIMTAFVTPGKYGVVDKPPNVALQQNMDRLGKLGQLIRAAGYGYGYLDGHYTYQNGEVGDERSVYVVGRPSDNGDLRAYAIKWMHAVDQESVLFKPKGDVIAYLLYADGHTDTLGVLHPDRVGPYYSRIRRGSHTFVFESALYEKGFFGRMAEDVARRAGRS